MNLNSYEELLSELDNEKDLLICEMKFKSSAKGLYQDNVIAINKNIDTINEKRCILAEEFGHHKKTYGNIQRLDTTENIKQEYKARLFAFENLISMEELAKCLNKGVTSQFELANMLNVTEDFLIEALNVYKNKYGFNIINTKYGSLIFEPRLMYFKELKGFDTNE
ncbi:ImmA/IrrE family metallo-endopeptidase [Fusobacterium sp.]|uniref:ImmA/IrrE family metallo-endopeptidase n=1 Tax=Fusobacterium sp. TaxID=68766 RepID=UPI00260AE26B|nr:ImmA/IrrE family metallo-endopeptidase [Fusobacterium sp.]